MSTSAVFANTGFIGFPLMQALFGEYGLLLAAVFNLLYNVFLYSRRDYIVEKAFQADRSVQERGITVFDNCFDTVRYSMENACFYTGHNQSGWQHDCSAVAYCNRFHALVNQSEEAVHRQQILCDGSDKNGNYSCRRLYLLILVSRHFEILPVTKYTMLL